MTQPHQPHLANPTQGDPNAVQAPQWGHQAPPQQAQWGPSANPAQAYPALSDPAGPAYPGGPSYPPGVTGAPGQGGHAPNPGAYQQPTPGQQVPYAQQAPYGQQAPYAQQPSFGQPQQQGPWAQQYAAGNDAERSANDKAALGAMLWAGFGMVLVFFVHTIGIIAGFGAYYGVRALISGNLSTRGRVMAIAGIVFGAIGVFLSLSSLMR